MDGSTRDGRDPVAIAAVWQRLFGDVSDEAIAAVNTRVEWIELHGGAYLMRQGDEADRAYILVRGRLRAVVEGGDDGRRVVGEIAPGEIVGEMALMTGQPRSASVYAIRDSLLACLSRSSFETLIDSHPELVIGLSRVLIRRLERSLHAGPVPTEVCNIAILLPRPSPVAGQFIDRLVAALEHHGPTLRLDRQTVVERLRAQHILADPDGEAGADGNTLVSWLDEQERSHRFVVYVADRGASGWSRRCVRQADRVMLVSGANDDPAPGEVEADPTRPPSSVAEPSRELVLVHEDGDTLPRNTRRWFEGRQLQSVHHVRLDREGDVARVARFLAGTAVGFALAGGGAKGFAHLGAVRALKEAGIPLDVVGGTSIGAVLAAAIARDWDLDMMTSNVREAFTRGNPLRDFALLPLVSLMQGRRLEARLEGYLGDADIEDLWLPFLCVSSNLTRARARVHRRGPAVKAIRASLSIPGVLPPVVYGNDLHVDGGSLDNLPADLLRTAGAGRVIAGELIFDRVYELGYDRVPSVWSLLHDRYVTRRRRLKVPGIVNIMLNATVLGGRDRARQAAERADLRIPIEVQKIGLVDWKAFDRAVEIGYRQTVQILENESEIVKEWSTPRR